MKKYKIIYADPPWSYGSKQYQDGNREFDPLNRQYPTMTVKQIKELDIASITDRDCALFLWVTDSHLKEGLSVMEAWGFEYKTVAFVWVKKYKTGKTCVNFAPWTLKSTEMCLLGIKGSMGKHKEKNNVQSLVEAERTIHSKKPDEVRTRIEQLFGGLPRIELFARQNIQGWDVWGNEVSSKLFGKHMMIEGYNQATTQYDENVKKFLGEEKV